MTISFRNSGLAVLSFIFGRLAMSGLRPAPSDEPKRYAKRKTPIVYKDYSGLPHGRSNDKLRRKAMRGTIGIRHTSPLTRWALARHNKD